MHEVLDQINARTEEIIEQKETSYSQEKYGYIMFELFGLILIVLASFRAATREVEWTDHLNLLVGGLGLLFLIGTLLLSTRKGPSGQDKKWMRLNEDEKEESSLILQSADIKCENVACMTKKPATEYERKYELFEGRK